MSELLEIYNKSKKRPYIANRCSNCKHHRYEEYASYCNIGCNIRSCDGFEASRLSKNEMYKLKLRPRVELEVSRLLVDYIDSQPDEIREFVRSIVDYQLTRFCVNPVEKVDSNYYTSILLHNGCYDLITTTTYPREEEIFAISNAKEIIFTSKDKGEVVKEMLLHERGMLNEKARTDN